jgi:hypothetical protein
MVVAEHSAETLTPLYGVMGQGGGGQGLQEAILESLMITLGMVMRHKLADCVLKERLCMANC